jgi:1-acyl-sn-glycerol-3-phosphate acyltransferase
LNAGVPIAPVAVRGTDRLWPFKRIEVSVGPAVLPDLPAWWALSRRVSTMVDRVRGAISTALARRRADPSTVRPNAHSPARRPVDSPD